MNTVTVEGNAYYGKDKKPELRFTASGMAMLTFSVGFYQGKDKEKGFISVTCFRDMAEHVAQSVQHGDSVVVVGRLDHRKWEGKNGGIGGSALGVVADAVGPSLRWNTVTVDRIATTAPAEAAAPGQAAFVSPSSDPF